MFPVTTSEAEDKKRVFITETNFFLCEIIAEADIIVLVSEHTVLCLVPAEGEAIIDHSALSMIDFKFLGIAVLNVSFKLLRPKYLDDQGRCTNLMQTILL